MNAEIPGGVARSRDSFEEVRCCAACDFAISTGTNDPARRLPLMIGGWPLVKVTPARLNEEDSMAAKKISTKSKKTSAKKGARKVSPTTPRGMARAHTTNPGQMTS